MTHGDHIVRSFSRDLERLSDVLIRMAGVAEALVQSATEAVGRRNATLAGQVVAAEAQMSGYAQEIDTGSLRLLAMRQPLGQDLREILATIRIAADLAQIGANAAEIGRRAGLLARMPALRPAAAILPMGRLVSQILKDVVDAHVDRDADRARAAWARDTDLDALYTSLFREILTYMMEDPRTITACTHLIFVAKGLERVGDHATNIAETVHHLILGERLSLVRPKGDLSSYSIDPVEVE